MTQNREKFFIIGGAGFIGSHFCDRILSSSSLDEVTVFDNFSSGREWHYSQHLKNPRFKVIRGDVKDLELLTNSMKGHDTVIHLASNPDIARAATEPDIDFREGTYLTQNVVEAMRVSGTKHILYASGSGVYGDLGNYEAPENHGPLLPVSTYGASKLAGETLICSYCYMFDMTGRAFRFGNVVGPHQTHGVGFDFVRRLLQDPTQLKILGDGSQSKSYIHVFNVVDAVLSAHKHQPSTPFQAYNVATGDYITVKDIADLAIECVGLSGKIVKLEYTGGDRGWKGDVPIVRLNTDKIKGIGWACTRSTRQALKESILSMIIDAKEGRI